MTEFDPRDRMSDDDVTADPDETRPRPLHEPDEVPLDPQKEREREKD